MDNIYSCSDLDLNPADISFDFTIRRLWGGTLNLLGGNQNLLIRLTFCMEGIKETGSPFSDFHIAIASNGSICWLGIIIHWGIYVTYKGWWCCCCCSYSRKIGNDNNNNSAAQKSSFSQLWPSVLLLLLLWKLPPSVIAFPIIIHSCKFISTDSHCRRSVVNRKVSFQNRKNGSSTFTIVTTVGDFTYKRPAHTSCTITNVHNFMLILMSWTAGP